MKCQDCGLDVDTQLERAAGVVMCVVEGGGKYCARCMQRGAKRDDAAPVPARGAKR